MVLLYIHPRGKTGLIINCNYKFFFNFIDFHYVVIVNSFCFVILGMYRLKSKLWKKTEKTKDMISFYFLCFALLCLAVFNLLWENIDLSISIVLTHTP